MQTANKAFWSQHELTKFILQLSEISSITTALTDRYKKRQTKNLLDYANLILIYTKSSDGMLHAEYLTLNFSKVQDIFDNAACTLTDIAPYIHLCFCFSWCNTNMFNYYKKNLQNTVKEFKLRTMGKFGPVEKKSLILLFFFNRNIRNAFLIGV